MTLFLILLALILTAYVYKKSGLFSATFIHCLYCSGCALTLFIVNEYKITVKQVSFSAMPLPNFESVLLHTLVIYVGFIVIAVLINPSTYSNKTSNPKAIGQLVYILEKNLTSVRAIKIILALSIVFIVCHSLHFLSINHSVLISNTNYLSIKDPNLIGLTNPIGRIYHFLFRYVGLVFMGLTCFLFLCNQKKVALLTFFVSFYPFLFLLAGNSRWAGFYIAIAILVFTLKKQKLAALISFVLLILIMQKVLIGRNMLYQGLSHTFDYLTIHRNENFTYTLMSMCINIFEGAMNVSNTLLHDPNFNSTYKNLSFSPLFSFMDGFSAIRDTMKYKWAPNVPMSAISESYQFGYFYFFIFIALYFYLLRSIEILFNKNMSIAVLIIFFIFIYISVGMHTYSVRTFWKLMIFLAISLYILRKKKRQLLES